MGNSCLLISIKFKDLKKAMLEIQHYESIYEKQCKDEDLRKRLEKCCPSKYEHVVDGFKVKNNMKQSSIIGKCTPKSFFCETALYKDRHHYCENIKRIFLKLIKSNSDGIDDKELKELSDALYMNYYFSYKARRDSIDGVPFMEFIKNYADMYAQDKVIPERIVSAINKFLESWEFIFQYMFGPGAKTKDQFHFKLINIDISVEEDKYLKYQLKYDFVTQQRECTIIINCTQEEFKNWDSRNQHSLFGVLKKYVFSSDFSDICNHHTLCPNMKDIKQYFYDRKRASLEYREIYCFVDEWYIFNHNAFLLKKLFLSYHHTISNYSEEVIEKSRDNLALFEILFSSKCIEGIKKVFVLVEEIQDIFKASSIKISNLHDCSNKNNLDFLYEVQSAKTFNNNGIFIEKLKAIHCIIKNSILPQDNLDEIDNQATDFKACQIDIENELDIFFLIIYDFNTKNESSKKNANIVEKIKMLFSPIGKPYDDFNKVIEACRCVIYKMFINFDMKLIYIIKSIEDKYNEKNKGCFISDAKVTIMENKRSI